MDGDAGRRNLMRQRLASLVQGAGEVFYGMALHEMVRQHARSRGSLEHLFILITMGDLVGVPILPPYYSLRLVPFVVPQVNNWRRRLVRERDLLDLIG